MPFSIASAGVYVRAAERRCDGLAVFVKEENKRLGGPFEVDIFNNMTLEECQTMCVRAEKYVHFEWRSLWWCVECGATPTSFAE